MFKGGGEVIVVCDSRGELGKVALWAKIGPG